MKPFETITTKSTSNMKTKLLLGLATAAMLTACSNDELVRVNTDSTNAIGFSTFVNKSTRATDIDNNNIGKGFAVFGMTDTGTNGEYEYIFLGEPVSGSDTGTNGNYTYEHIQYWEKGHAYRFHAIAPFNNDYTDDPLTWKFHWSLTTDTDIPEWALIGFTNIESTTDNDATTYTAKGDQDLMYAFRSVASAKERDNDKVQLEFAHLLSRVKFRFVGDANNPSSVKINVNNVTLKGTYDKGEISINNTNDDGVIEASDKSTVEGSDWKFENIGENRTETAQAADLPFGGIDENDIFTTGQAETKHKYVIPVNESKQ
jgi:hypothetical protein